MNLPVVVDPQVREKIYDQKGNRQMLNHMARLRNHSRARLVVWGKRHPGTPTKLFMTPLRFEWDILTTRHPLILTNSPCPFSVQALGRTNPPLLFRLLGVPKQSHGSFVAGNARSCASGSRGALIQKKGLRPPGRQGRDKRRRVVSPVFLRCAPCRPARASRPLRAGESPQPAAGL